MILEKEDVQMAFIKVENLTHIYHPGTPQEIVALDKVNLSIEAGEFVAVLGTNGSGEINVGTSFEWFAAAHGGKVLYPWVGYVR